MSLLLLCLAGIVLIVTVTYVAVYKCQLDKVEFHLNLLKLGMISFSVKSQPLDRTTARTPVPKSKSKTP